MTIFAYLLLIMALPVFFFQGWKIGPGHAGAHSGDEPHYLVMLNSIVLDGDLDLRNDYAKKRYGRELSRYTLDHHTYFVHRESGERIAWEKVYGIRENARGDDFELFQRPGAPAVPPGEWLEYPLHPMGYPFLLAPLAAPLLLANPDHPPDYESFLIFAQLFLLALLGAVVARGLGARKGNRLLYVLLFLSFPVWVYASSFYPEALAAPLFLGAVWALRFERYALLGFCAGALILIKDVYIPVVAVFALAPLLALIGGSRVRIGFAAMSGIIRFALPAGMGMGVFLFKNWIFLGDPLATYVPFRFEPNPAGALAALLVSPHKGLLAFSPVLVLIPFYIKRYTREHRREALLVIIAAVVLIAITVSHANWSGGPSFAYRTIAPAIFMFLPMLYRGIAAGSRSARLLAIVLAIPAVVNMFYAATHLKHSYNSPAYINVVSPGDSHWSRRFR